MIKSKHHSKTFNSPLEVGVRAICILVNAYPNAYDIHKLTTFDYLVVHTGDINGPESLHPPLPKRATELLVRKQLVEEGLTLLMSRGLVERILSEDGISYRAGEFSETFLESLTSPYLKELNNRAKWVVNHYGCMDIKILKETINTITGHWTDEFGHNRPSLGAK
jgi:hypothetical protein